MITSRTNSIVKEIKKLEQKKYRQAYQVSLIYNDKVINEALSAKQVVCLITDQAMDVDCSQLLVSSEILSYLHPHNHGDLLALVKLNQPQPIVTNKVLVLDHIQDPGNLGSMLRSACAFGIKDVVLSEGCCDVDSHKVIVSSAGSIFKLNINVCNLESYLQNTNLPTIMSFLDEPASDSFPDKFNLVLGNENHGIDQKLKQYCDYNYLIPTCFESLNVSVACGIMLANLG